MLDGLFTRVDIQEGWHLSVSPEGDCVSGPPATVAIDDPGRSRGAQPFVKMTRQSVAGTLHGCGTTPARATKFESSRNDRRWKQLKGAGFVFNWSISMRRLVAAALVSGAIIWPAQASVISFGPIDLGGQGLGASDPLLTIHALKSATTETGTLSTLAGPTFGDLNWASASDVRLVFNATEPAGNGITIDTITFSFESSSATLNLSNSAPLVFASTNPGVGNSGFLLGLDAAQTMLLATFLQFAPNVSDVRFGMTASLSDVAGGPETFSAVSQVPLPAAAWLFLSALAGLGLLGVRRRARQAT
jgi:hypothetical protein